MLAITQKNPLNNATPNPLQVNINNINKNGINNVVNDGFGVMKQFEPYYPEVLTDSSVEYQFPSVPNQFTLFANSGVNNIPRGSFGIFPATPKSNNNTGSPIFIICIKKKS